ncbi:MAG: hypothetical protein M3O34_18235 [Chloroflexota bacterium]|nr:hypothetical protein [Chloroflexota bacterium]
MLGVNRAGLMHAGPFVGGMTVGVLVGFVAGSALTLLIGEATLEAVKDLVDRLSGRRDRVNFELLLQ